MPEEAFATWWAQRQAVVPVPEHITVANAGQIREELLVVINRGAAVVIVDMSSTRSCDHAGINALARAYQRAVVSHCQLRLVVTAPTVRRVLAVEGLDRLIATYPTVDAALAAEVPGGLAGAAARPETGQRAQAAGGGAQRGRITPALLWQLLDTLGDGLVLADQDGRIALATRRTGEIFGYEPGALTGRPVEVLVPAGLRAGHPGHRAAYARQPTTRPMGERQRLVGQRADGATVPVEISLTPVPTATGLFILAVIRDAAGSRHRQDLAGLAQAAVAEQARQAQDLLDRVTNSLFHVGISLQAGARLPAEAAREQIAGALQQLDDTITAIRDRAFATRSQPPPPPNGTS